MFQSCACSLSPIWNGVPIFANHKIVLTWVKATRKNVHPSLLRHLLSPSYRFILHFLICIILTKNHVQNQTSHIISFFIIHQVYYNCLPYASKKRFFTSGNVGRKSRYRVPGRSGWHNRLPLGSWISMPNRGSSELERGDLVRKVLFQNAHLDFVLKMKKHNSLCLFATHFLKTI